MAASLPASKSPNRDEYKTLLFQRLPQGCESGSPPAALSLHLLPSDRGSCRNHPIMASLRVRTNYPQTLMNRAALSLPDLAPRSDREHG